MRERRFVLLLCALTLLIGSAPLVRAVGSGRHPVLARSVITSLFVLMLLSAVFAVSRSRTTQIIAILLAIPTINVKSVADDLRFDGGHAFDIDRGAVSLCYFRRTV